MEPDHSTESGERSFFAKLLESTYEAIFVTELDGTILYWNRAAESLYGYTSQEAVGRKSDELFHTFYPTEKASSVKGQWDGEVTRTIRDGRTIIIECRQVAFEQDNRPLIIEYSLDITERKRADEALLMREQQLRFVSDHAAISISHCDAQERYLFVNQPNAERFNLTPEQIKGKTIREVLGEAAYESIAPYVRAALRGERVQFEVNIPYATGLRWMSCIYVPEVAADGQVKSFVAVIQDVTERKQAEEALRASEERFSKAFDASPLALTITSLKTGRLVAVNETFVQLTGYTREEAVGRTTLELGLWSKPDDRNAELAMVINRGQVRNLEYRFRMKDGRELTGLLSAERLDIGNEPCAITVIEDITERKRAEEALRESEERLRLALDAGQVGTWDWDILNNRVTWSDLIYQFHGLKPGDFNGRVEDFAALVQPEDRERVNAAIRNALEKKESYSIEMRIVKPDGTVRWIATNGKVIFDKEGRAMRMLGATVDVHERKQMEESLREADRRKDEFLAMLAHELRNPLAPIRNALLVLRHIGPPEPQLQQMHDMIERQTEHLSRLVDDLLDVSRITRGGIELHREMIDLLTLIGRALETSRPLIDARRHNLTISLPKETIRLEGDVVRLAQVIANLLNNAAKYTDEGGTLHLSAEREGEEVIIRVSDNGMGISAETLPHIFDLFTQAERSLDRAQGGLGIGLTVVKSLVEMHGGRVEVHSEGLNKGSVFTVRLPIVGESESKTIGRSTANARANNAMLLSNRCRVLVVDDNVDSAESMAMLLGLEGHDVQMANDGWTTLEIARQFNPQVVLLDIGLPGMNGYEVAQQIRKEPQLQNTILIALTGYGQEEDRLRSKEAGFDHHLTKPVDYHLLLSLINSHHLG